MLFKVIVTICEEQLLGIHNFKGTPMKALRTKCIMPLSIEINIYVLVTAIIFKK